MTQQPETCNVYSGDCVCRHCTVEKICKERNLGKSKDVQMKKGKKYKQYSVAFDPTKTHVFTLNNKTVAMTKLEGTNSFALAYAHCHESDTYDFELGAKIARQRLHSFLQARAENPDLKFYNSKYKNREKHTLFAVWEILSSTELAEWNKFKAAPQNLCSTKTERIPSTQSNAIAKNPYYWRDAKQFPPPQTGEWILASVLSHVVAASYRRFGRGYFWVTTYIQSGVITYTVINAPDRWCPIPSAINNTTVL